MNKANPKPQPNTPYYREVIKKWKNIYDFVEYEGKDRRKHHVFMIGFRKNNLRKLWAILSPVEYMELSNKIKKKFNTSAKISKLTIPSF